MANELSYNLFNPGYTIYHRAALGGLAATVKAWKNNFPTGIKPEVTRDSVTIRWDDSITDQEAIQRLLAASFRLNSSQLIELVGQNIPESADDLRLAIHVGLCETFLQHNKMRPSEGKPRSISLRSPDDDTPIPFTYKAVLSYAHQKAQKTGLLDPSRPPGSLPAIGAIPQFLVPGTTQGMRELEASAAEVFLLHYLMVGSAVFLLRPSNSDARVQSCIIVPDVCDLLKFARELHGIAAVAAMFKGRGEGYLNRIAGGAEEAALRFLIDLVAQSEIADGPGVAGCQALLMGKVAWNPQQTSRSGSFRVGLSYDELGIFKAAEKELGKARIIKTKKGEGLAVTSSPVPALVAANLAAGQHWATHFRTLVVDRKAFGQISYSRGGLHAMVEAITDEDDKALINAFHEAWEHTMGQLGERSRNEGADFSRLVDVDREKIRNSILRAKTPDALANWFLRFCASATKGNSLPAFRDHASRLRSMLFNMRHFERCQNLLLFALLSYESKDKKPQSASSGKES